VTEKVAHIFNYIWTITTSGCKAKPLGQFFLFQFISQKWQILCKKIKITLKNHICASVSFLKIAEFEHSSQRKITALASLTC
jgi:hypothetical protein